MHIKKLSRVNNCTLEVALQGRANNSSISSSHYPNFLDNNDDDVDKLLDLIPPDQLNMKQRSITLSDNLTPNLLINRKGQRKIADFGLAHSRNPAITRLTNKVIMLWYRPPEQLFRCTSYNDKIDMWSVGCIIAEMFK